MPTQEKLHGIHYTPVALAGAVAKRLASELALLPPGREVRVADPACGDGELLHALVSAIPDAGPRVRAFAFDRDSTAVRATCERLGGIVPVTSSVGDFLARRSASEQAQESLFAERVALPEAGFDVIIANPPYVRTQVLGADRAQELAARYGLRGRVDLAYAFVIAMIESLNVGGYFAIIVSNKFLTIKAGSALREFLRAETRLIEVWDLGDSRLFSAAVLPAVLFGQRQRGSGLEGVRFRGMYEQVDRSTSPDCVASTDEGALHVLADAKGRRLLDWKGSLWAVRVGHVAVQKSSGSWILEDDAVQSIQRAIRRTRTVRFGDVLRTSVGIKTTADNVYIRKDWYTLPPASRPEEELLLPVRLTADIARWVAPAVELLTSRVFYPFRRDTEKRTPIDLSAYPGAAAYLELHRAQLESRRYVMDSGREWFEPWVPHNPARWPMPRVVFRDIAAHPTFAVDTSGAIPNGTLYWSSNRGDVVSEETLWAACAIANSHWAGEFYDLVLGTRLYAGRRRYNTQAVDDFPFPGSDKDVRELAALARLAAAATTGRDSTEIERVEREVDRYCRACFGLPEGASASPIAIAGD